jgi:hypothetical protein
MEWDLPILTISLPILAPPIPQAISVNLGADFLQISALL